jgi:hypothetical protein
MKDRTPPMVSSFGKPLLVSPSGGSPNRGSQPKRGELCLPVRKKEKWQDQYGKVNLSKNPYGFLCVND